MRNLTLITLAAAASVAMAKTNWKPLFNGKSFAPEWYISGVTDYWTVDAADSAIVGKSTTSTPYTMVFTNKKDFDQFTVKYSYRLKGGCSGFFFRSKQTTSVEQVQGCQVEAKYEGGGEKEVGSLYVHPNPGWVVQHTAAYSTKIAKPSDQYQDVVLTVKRPYIYVNVNGNQAVGETDQTELNAGAKRAWDYTGNALVQNPGQFGLQIHAGQTNMDVRFKNIMILEGCGDAGAPGFDGAFVPGFPKQPAVYQDNASCTGTDVNEAKPDLMQYFGTLSQNGRNLGLAVTFPGKHSLEIVSLDGKVLFSGSAPGANEYHWSRPLEAGIYVAKISTASGMASRKILIN